MIEWNPVGARLSNTILQALITLLQTPPPKGRRLLILATTSQRTIMDQLDVTSAFDWEIPVPAVGTLRELSTVLSQAGMFESGGDINEAINVVREYTSAADSVGVGIKTILTTAETAQSSPDPIRWFGQQLATQILRYNPVR